MAMSSPWQAAQAAEDAQSSGSQGGFGSDGIATRHESPSSSNANPPRLVAPTQKVWEHYRTDLVNLNKKGMTAKQLDKWMRNAGYHTTPKMISNHLNKWGEFRYQNKRKKDALCRQLIDDHNSGRVLTQLDPQQVKKLHRYIKEKPKESDDDKLVLKLLSSLESSVVSSDRSREQSYGAVASPPYSETAEPWQMIGNTTIGPIDALVATDLAAYTTAAFAMPMFTTADAYQPQLINYVEPTVSFQPLHFGDKYLTIHSLLKRCQQYYAAKINEYTLQPPELYSFTDPFAQNELFWNKIRCAVYFLKMNNEKLSKQDTDEAVNHIPYLCDLQPLSLLKELFSTLSPLSTRVSPEFRIKIIQHFYEASIQRNGPDHPFTCIFQLLLSEEGSDELAVTALQALADESQRVLAPNHSEHVELQRAIIQFRRRNREYHAAQARADVLVQNCELVHGKNHWLTRIALTESVHILNDQHLLRQAHEKAADVLVRGQADLADQYPDDKCIYAMEDIAEICDRMGRIDDCIAWLRKAVRAAVKEWGNSTSTEHIQDKLDETTDRARLGGRIGVSAV